MNDDGADVADVFARLAVELHEEPGVEETVEAVLQFALQAVTCTYAGLLSRHHGRLTTLAVTDPVVEQCDKLQLDTGQGPALELLRGCETVLVPDTLKDDRWPDWAPQAAALGLRSLLCVRLWAGGVTHGVLQLINAEPDGFEPDDDAVAHILARHASVALATARQEESLRQAVDARKLIGQAQGILMERFGVDADQAFAVLRRYSQNSNTKLRDVAEQLIQTRRLPD
ncbi:ANTAR domain protein with unknown sensor [Kribbella flavida DSM 17836]|uniref:ANTAR domain-containing protein n=1 Tax=Kribbella flavida (strain DSM 17836 / JCM 10339 / NBRC 14399) TaxID=479435 RepID=D2PXH9_KRIFD|nr:GAF and ANTAR domain-containing protein [Kribbella flavida]ADB29827.1 ANTAR domain protein with unknown sensor [Kribbella flavida DSM 17836]